MALRAFCNTSQTCTRAQSLFAQKAALHLSVFKLTSNNNKPKNMLKNCVIRNAYYDDREQILRLLPEAVATGPHFLGSGCGVKDVQDLLTEEMQTCLKLPLSKVALDASNRIVGYSIVGEMTGDKRACMRKTEIPQSNNYANVERIIEYCRFNFWNHAPLVVEKIAVIQHLFVCKDYASDVYTQLIAETSNYIEKAAPSFHGILGIALSKEALFNFEASGFQPIFSCPQQLYVTSNEKPWQPTDGESATVLWRQIVTRNKGKKKIRGKGKSRKDKEETSSHRSKSTKK